VFLDADWSIRCLAGSVKPWRIGPICPGAAFAIELPAGTIARFRLERRQQFELVVEDEESLDANPRVS